MSEYIYEDINAESYKVTSEQSGDEIQINFTGDVDSRDPGQFLNPLFDNLHTWLMENKHPSVTVNFKNLKFMNSSGLKALARWIMKQTIKSEHKYTIVLIQDKNVTWQVTSLPTLTYLVPGIVKVQ